MKERDKEPPNRTGMVMAAIRRNVENRALTAGDRLPSIRSLARTMEVSPSTVVEAYDRLCAEGSIRARPGSGFYVAEAMPPLAIAHVGPKLDRAIDPLWISRQSLDRTDTLARPGCGWLPSDWMPTAAIRRAMRSVARGYCATLSDYGPARGSAALRLLLARQFAADGLEVGPDQILLTGSATQAFDLICRFLLAPGDTVLVDDPCYFNFRALLRAHPVTVVGVPYTQNGPDLDCFAQAAEAHRPRLYVTNSAVHNPTGTTISAQTAHHLLNIVTTNKMVIVEDDIFADFEPELSPRLATLDGLSRVLRIGGFSKALSASIRCGYIAGRMDWIEGLVDLQIATSFGGASPIAIDLVLSVLNDGGYRKHIEDVRRRLARARVETEARLQCLGVIPWSTPRGGFHLWCELPDGRDATAVAQAALRDGIILAPGDIFSVSQTKTAFMRFNVTQMEVDEAYPALKRAIDSAENCQPPDITVSFPR